MSIEGPKLGISNSELNNNNFNPELDKFLEDNIISQEETSVLHDLFSEKRADIYHISKQNLSQLRNIIWSKSKKGWITDNDMNKLKNKSEINKNTGTKADKYEKRTKQTTKNKINNTSTSQSSNLNEKNEINKNNYIDSNWKLINVRKITLMDLIALGYDSINSIIWNKYKFSISNTKWETFNVFLWSTSSGIKNYYYWEGPKKNQRVKIYDWYKLWATASNQESNDKKSNNFDSPEGYDTIDNPEQLKQLLENRDITKADIDKWIQKWYKTIKLWVGWKKNRVSVKELDKFYKEFISAQDYSRLSILKWIWANRKKVDYKAMKDFWKESIDKLSGIGKFIAIWDKYLSAWITESNLKHLQFLPKYTHAQEKEAIRKTGRWLIKHAWCAYFIDTVLKEAWYPTLSREFAGRSRAYIWETWTGHIGIKKGGSMINWNTWDTIWLSPINYSELRWWILPNDVWQPNKAHKWPFSNKSIIPDWAILVFWRNPSKKSHKKWA